MKRKKTEKEKFKELKDKWYKKLEDSGFVDAELDEDRLKVYSSSILAYGNQTSWKAKQDYYQMAENFLTDYKFDNYIEHIVWEYHTNGISVQNIAVLLTKAKVWKTNRTDVWKVVKRLRSSMYSMYLAPHKEQRE